jgi:uncharacterized protein YndB with AHSA1/START domain
MNAPLTAEITATVKGPASEIYRAWIDPRVLPLWLAPPPYQMVRAEVDAQVGGRYTHEVTGPDGEHLVVGKYLEAVPGRRIRKDWNYSGPNPAPRREATFVDVDLTDAPDGTTRVTIRHSGLRDAVELKHYQEGWAECLRRLRELRAGQ